MNREAAEAITSVLEESIKKLGESLVIAQSTMTETEYEDFKRNIGLAIGKISYDVLDPIYGRYPDLAPPGVL